MREGGGGREREEGGEKKKIEKKENRQDLILISHIFSNLAPISIHDSPLNLCFLFIYIPTR